MYLISDEDFPIVEAALRRYKQHLKEEPEYDECADDELIHRTINPNFAWVQEEAKRVAAVALRKIPLTPKDAEWLQNWVFECRPWENVKLIRELRRFLIEIAKG